MAAATARGAVVRDGNLHACNAVFSAQHALPSNTLRAFPSPGGSQLAPADLSTAAGRQPYSGKTGNVEGDSFALKSASLSRTVKIRCKTLGLRRYARSTRSTRMISIPLITWPTPLSLRTFLPSRALSAPLDQL